MHKSIYSCFLISLLLLIGTGSVLGEEKANNEETPEIPLYQGVGIKLDIGNTIYEAAISGGKGMSFEALAYVNLQRRYLPTIELGYGQLECTANNNAHFIGNGAFMRMGCDFNIMKNKEMGNMFLLGGRLGMALQECSVNNLVVTDAYWGITQPLPAHNTVRFDCWGELVGGVQVDVYKNFVMGWNMRIKLLFTQGKEGKFHPSYIPGFGHHNNTTFSFNYYIGYKLNDIITTKKHKK